MVDDRVEILDAELHSSRRAQLTQSFQGPQRGGPHRTGRTKAGARRQAVDKLRGVQVEARDAERLRGPDAQLRRPHHLVGGLRVDQVAVQIPGHRRELRAGRGQGIEVLVVPAPDLGGEAHVVDAAHPLDEGEIGEHHLGADREFEGAHERTAPESVTGQRVRIDSAAARAISSAMRASCPVTEGFVPASTHAAKCPNWSA